MKKELENKLFNRFEFYRPDLPQTASLMCFGFECGDGWFDLIWELSEKIEKLENTNESMDKKAKRLLLGNNSINVVQVKEKFGGLRFYIDGGIKGCQKLVNEYESKSYTICEVCGKEGKVRTGKWIKTLCDECYKKEKK